MIGTGYVGLVSGVCFSDLGNDVICVDKDINKINLLKKGKIPIYEPGLLEIVQEARGRNLFFSTEIDDNLRDSEVIFISVNTPTKTYGHGAGKFVFSRIALSIIRSSRTLRYIGPSSACGLGVLLTWLLLISSRRRLSGTTLLSYCPGA